MIEPNNTSQPQQVDPQELPPPLKVIIDEPAPGGSFSNVPVQAESTTSPHETQTAVSSVEVQRSLGEKALDRLVSIVNLSRPDK